jgi:uncharacterized protein
MAGTDGQQSTRNRGGWRWLSLFWVAVLSLMAIGGGVLQYLGPPEAGPLDASGRKSGSAHRVVGATSPDAGVERTRSPNEIAAARMVPPVVAGRDTPGPVVDPDPTLLEPLSDGSKESLPRIASDGRTAMRVYAAGFDHSSRRPRIGVLLAGIGMNEVESDAAIRTLPGAVTLGVSPYAASNGANLNRMLASARASGHEYLIAIPLEPTGFPLNDPGPWTLLTGDSPSANARKLDWALSRIDGYAGATGVIGGMRGERLANMTDQMDAVLSELARRGLLYVDPREDRGTIVKTPISRAWGRHVDLVIDDASDQGVADRAMIDAKLAALEQQALDAGSALGLVMRPTPVAVARIAVWSNGLAEHGLTLAPVSALAMPPAETPVKVSERVP